MKVTKSKIKSFIKSKLATDAAWALRALVRVYECQTATEQCVGKTNELNGVGFSGTDGEFLSSLATQFSSRKTLSAKQMDLVFKKMPRYWGQVAGFIGDEKLSRLIGKSV